MRAPLQRAPLPLPLPLLLAVVAAALCRPAAASILVIQQHDDAAEYQLEDSPSRFGPHVSMAGIGGYLILAEPLSACGPVDPPPSTPVRHHWILLISDDDCTSGEKVLSAQRAGYVAAIVFNTSGDGYSPMDSNADVTIPSFYIGLSNGIMLRTNFLYGSGYSIYISGYFPYTFLAFIIPAMLLIVLCLLVLIGIMLYRCISEYRRTARRLLPKRMLAQIPTRRYGGAADSGGAGGQDMCAICLEDYQQGDLLRVLPCRHAFHCQCVDPWLLRSRRVCPVCKRRLISATLAVLVSESEDEQLLPVYRSQRPPPGRRTYGATLTAHSAPAAAAASSAGDESRGGSRVRAPRRLRRTRRRQEARPSDPAGSVPTAASVSSAPAPAAAAAGDPDDVSGGTGDVIDSADNVCLLDDPAPLAVSSGQCAAEVTEEPLDDAQSSRHAAQLARPQESNDRDGLAGGVSEGRSETNARSGSGADLV